MFGDLWMGAIVLFLAGLTNSPRTPRVALVALIATALIGVLVVMQNSLLDSRDLPVIPTTVLIVIWFFYLIARWRAWPERLQQASRIVFLVALVPYMIWLVFSSLVLY